MLKAYLFCIVLLLKIENVSAACTQEQIKQDLILMIDYSGSICPEVRCCDQATQTTFDWSVSYPGFWCEYEAYARCCVNEWFQILDFTRNIVENQIPNGTEILTMGFGQPQGYVHNGWYAPHIGNPNTIWKTPEETAAAIMNVNKVGGQTWLGAGIDFLLDDSGVKWSTERLDRKRLMLVLTDGAATDADTLCQRTPRLRRLGIQVVIVGITSGFSPDSMSCLVEDEANEIIKVDSWVSLNQFGDQVGGFTCETEQQWVLTEVKAGGTDKYLEYTNIGIDYLADGNNIVRVSSNIFDVNYVDFATRADQGSRVVIGSTASPPTHCTSQNDCTYYGNIPLTSLQGPEGWTTYIYDHFPSGNGRRELQSDEAILTVDWDATFPTLDDADHSLELPNIGFDPTQGANWRRSCDLGGGFGAASLDQCGPCGDDSECQTDGDLANSCCKPNSNCSPEGCVCTESGYYDGSGTGSCQKIPQPPACRFHFNTDPSKTLAQRITWDPAPGSEIYGYSISVPGRTTTIYGSVLEARFPIEVASGGLVTVKAIGEITSGLNPQATRWSKEMTCVQVDETASPTMNPSNMPSPEPTEYQPLVFLGGFELDSGNNIRDLVFRDDDDSIEVDVRIYLAPPDRIVTVQWKTFNDAGTAVETGTVTFPADALAMLQDVQKAQLTKSLYPIGSGYSIVLQPTSDVIPNDKPQVTRSAYDLYDPKSLNFRVVTPERAPTLQPTHYQPFALLGSFTMNNETDEPFPKRFLTNEEYRVRVRILPSVPFVVTVSYKVTDIVTGFVVDEGDVVFPADALHQQLDIQDVVLSNLTLRVDQFEHDWLFEILPTTNTIPGDSDDYGRKMYELFFPYSMNVTVERYVESAVGITETRTEEKLDWWLILIICLISVGALILVGCVGYRYYIGYKIEKESRKQVEEELAFEEDGIDGFYARAGVNHAHENPLHRQPEHKVQKAEMVDAEMIMQEDQLFSMDSSRKEFDQRMIGTDEFGKRTTNPNSMDRLGVSVPQRGGNTSVSSDGYYEAGEKSPSTYQVEEGTLPQSFQDQRTGRAGSIKYQL